MTRDYTELTRRIASLGLHPSQLETLGTAHGHPLLKLTLPATVAPRQRVLLSAGLHGDEPAGPGAILEFLSRDHSRWRTSIEFTILPCINPHGYVHNTRENGDGIDLNRRFDSDTLTEVVLTKKVLQNQHFDLFIEFHEDWEYSGFYLFEQPGQHGSFGPHIIEAVRQTCPIHPGPEVDGMPVSNGIVQTGAVEARIEIMPLYVRKHHSHHVITCESPSQLELPQRIQSHLAALDTALGLLLQTGNPGHSG